MADQPKPRKVRRKKYGLPSAELGELGRIMAQRLEERRREEEEAAQVDAAFIEAAIKWLRQKWGRDRVCPYCGVVAWEVGTPFELPTATGDYLSPHFPVMCGNCGNTVFINAVRAGLLPEPEWE